MLSLSFRVARGSRPAVPLRRLPAGAAAAGTGFLLLTAAGRASLPLLAWCTVPFAVSAYLAVLTARAEPRVRPGRPEGPGAASAALHCALSCALGSAVALAAYDGTHRAVPWAGALTLLALLPAVAAVATAVSLRAPRPGRSPRGPAVAPAGLPWGAALVVIGVAVEFSARPGAGPAVPLPGGLGRIGPALLGGWALTAAGLVLAVPGLVHGCGRLLAAGRPGALRLLAGRALQEDARRIGRPVGVVCAVASALVGVVALHGSAALHGSGGRPAGPLTLLGVVLVTAGAVGALLSAAVEAGHARRPVTDALTGLGAPASLLRGAAALRGVVVIAAVVPVTWAVAELAASPL